MSATEDAFVCAMWGMNGAAAQRDGMQFCGCVFRRDC